MLPAHVCEMRREASSQAWRTHASAARSAPKGVREEGLWAARGGQGSRGYVGHWRQQGAGPVWLFGELNAPPCQKNGLSLAYKLIFFVCFYSGLHNHQHYRIMEAEPPAAPLPPNSTPGVEKWPSTHHLEQFQSEFIAATRSARLL